MRAPPVAVVIVSVLAVSCGQNGFRSTDTTADSAAVMALIERVQQLAQMGDIDAYLDLYTEDAVWMLPDRFTDVGKEEARSFYSFLERYTFDQELTVNEIQVAGDWAFARLSVDGYIRPRVDVDAEPIRAITRHLWLFRRQPDGSWKLARDIFNTPPESDG